jgi:glycosyltransferase involved in cell wall biosynthesis
MEAMAMGLPTIGSRWSGNLAFMHDANSFLVDGALVPVDEAAQRHTPLYRGHRWFEPDVDALVDALRTVAGGATKGDTRAELIERFGPDVTAERIAELTMDLLDRPTSAPLCVWRGDFGSGHSLAVVNDGHVAALEGAGAEVLLREKRSAPATHDVPGVAGHWPPSFDAPSDGPFVLYQPWEYGCVPQRWVDSIRNVVDEVWVPSNAVRDGFVESGVAPGLVHVVPNGVDLDRFTVEGPARALPTERSTVFLFVGGTIPRKGVDVLLGAYRAAFTAADDVCLVVKAFGGTNVYRNQTQDDLFAGFNAPDSPELVILDEDIPFDELPALYRAADVLVQPYRAEGFCLPALEGLACGLPLVVTAGGPTDDFVSDACAWRIPASRTPVPADTFAHEGLTLAGDGYALEPDPAALAAALREAAGPTARAARSAHARAHAERFGWAQAAQVARERLAALQGRTPIRQVAAAAVPGSRGFVFLVQADWDEPQSWEAPLHAYLDAFSEADDVTLVFPDADGRAAELLEPALERHGCDPTTSPDIALARPSELAAASLELGADAVIHAAGAPPTRARLVVDPDPAALRAAVPLLQEAA